MEGVMSKTVAGWTPPKAGRPPEFIPLNDGMTGRRSNLGQRPTHLWRELFY